MGEFKKTFAVKSKGKKEIEKEDETRRTWYMALVEVEEHEMKLFLHSEHPIELQLGDEIEIRATKRQKTLKEAKE